MGAGTHSEFKHWSDITAKGVWFTPKRTPVDPANDLAYLVYSSVRENPHPASRSGLR